MAVEVILPRVDMDMTSGVISKWHVREGDRVVRGSALFEIETGKAAMEIDAPADGVLGNIIVSEGGTAPVGSAVAYILEAGELPATLPLPATAPPLPAAPTPIVNASGPSGIGASPSIAGQAPGGGIRATPLARRLAREARLDLAEISGSGPHGRITADDVKRRPPVADHGSPPLTLGLTCRIDSLLEVVDRLNLCTPHMISAEAIILKALALAVQQVPDLASLQAARPANIQFRRSHVIADAASLSLSQITDQLKLRGETPAGDTAVALWTFLAEHIEEASIPATSPIRICLTVGATKERCIIRDGTPVSIREANCRLACDPRAIQVEEAGMLLTAFCRLMEDPLLMLA